MQQGKVMSNRINRTFFSNVDINRSININAILLGDTATQSSWEYRHSSTEVQTILIQPEQRLVLRAAGKALKSLRGKARTDLQAKAISTCPWNIFFIDRFLACADEARANWATNTGLHEAWGKLPSTHSQLRGDVVFGTLRLGEAELIFITAFTFYQLGFGAHHIPDSTNVQAWAEYLTADM